MNTPGARIRQVRKRLGINQTEFGHLAGRTKGAVSQWESDAGLPDREAADALAKSGVNMDYILHGIGDALTQHVVDPSRLADASSTHPSTAQMDPLAVNVGPSPTLVGPSARRVPVVGAAQLGDNGHWADLEHPVGFGDGYIEWRSNDAYAYALRCWGRSMTPRVKDGEFVIIEPNHPWVPGDEVMVKALDGRVMVKQFLYERDGQIHLASINETHGIISLRRDEIEKIHYVAGIAKSALWIPE